MSAVSPVWPDVREGELPNGLRVYVVEDRRRPVITCHINIYGAGGFFDPPDRRGLSLSAAACAREGTADMSATQIQQALDAWEAWFNLKSASRATATQFKTEGPSQHASRLLRLAADVLTTPTFPTEVVDAHCAAVVAEKAWVDNRLRFRVEAAWDEGVYGDHPGSRLHFENPSIDTLTREVLLTFVHERYVPELAVLGLTGDVTFADAHAMVGDSFAGWTSRGTMRPTAEAPKDPQESYCLVDGPAEDCSMSVGTLTPNRASEEFERLEVMSALFECSDVVRRLRGSRIGWGVSCEMSSLPFSGHWKMLADVLADDVGQTLRDTLSAIDDLRNGRFSDSDLEAARQATIAAGVKVAEDPHTLLICLSTSWLFQLPADYWQMRPTRIMAITRDEVIAVAQKYLAQSRLVAAVGGAADDLETQLADIGSFKLSSR